MIQLEAVRGSSCLFSVGSGEAVVIDMDTMNVSGKASLHTLVNQGGWAVPSTTPTELNLMCEVVGAALTVIDSAKKTEHVTSNTFRVPKSVRRAVLRGLSESSGDKIPAVALSLSQNDAVTRDDVRAVHSYFNSVNEESERDHVEWSLYGGFHGKKWSEAIFAADETPESPDGDIKDFGKDFEPVEEDNANPEDSDLNPDEPHLFDLAVDTGVCFICDREESDKIHTKPKASEASIYGYSDFTVSQRRAGFASGESVPLIWQFTDFVSPSGIEPENIAFCASLNAVNTADAFRVTHLYAHDEDTGDIYVFSPVARAWVPSVKGYKELFELEDDDASFVLDKFLQGAKSATLRIDEQAMFDQVEDWSFIDRISQYAQFGDLPEDAQLPAPAPVEPGYSPDERSTNAQKQLRDAKGRFASIGGRVKLPNGSHGVIIAHEGENLVVELDDGSAVRVPAKDARVEVGLARLEGEVEIVDNIGEMIDAYLAAPDNVDQLAMQGPPGDKPPLYLALVDKHDPNLVLNFVALVPNPDGGDALGYERKNSEWVLDPSIVTNFRSSSPPPTVKLDEDQIEMVYKQTDIAHGIRAEREEAKKKEAAEASQIPFEFGSHDDVFENLEFWTPLWGPNGEILKIVAAGVPGVADTPSDVQNARRLKRYWLYGPGAAKIRWGLRAGAWRRCVRQLTKYMGPERSKGYCANLFHERLGVWPGSKANRGRKNKR